MKTNLNRVLNEAFAQFLFDVDERYHNQKIKIARKINEIRKQFNNANSHKSNKID